MKYYGIADAHGLESFFHDKDSETSCSRKKFLQLRASLNRQRHACFYELSINKFEAKLVKKLIDNKMFKSALRVLKNYPNVKIENNSKNSWEMIPNSRLDPWWSDEFEDDFESSQTQENLEEFMKLEKEIN